MVEWIRRRYLSTRLLAFTVAYVGSRAIFAATGFRYRLFGEPFDLGKLLIDFGTWAALFLAAMWVLRRLEH